MTGGVFADYTMRMDGLTDICQCGLAFNVRRSMHLGFSGNDLHSIEGGRGNEATTSYYQLVNQYLDKRESQSSKFSKGYAPLSVPIPVSTNEEPSQVKKLYLRQSL